MEQFKRNVIMNKAGGKSGKNTYSYKLSLPARVIKELGINPDDRGVILTLNNGKLVIEKDTSENE